MPQQALGINHFCKGNKINFFLPNKRKESIYERVSVKGYLVTVEACVHTDRHKINKQDKLLFF